MNQRSFLFAGVLAVCAIITASATKHTAAAMSDTRLLPPVTRASLAFARLTVRNMTMNPALAAAEC